MVKLICEMQAHARVCEENKLELLQKKQVDILISKNQVLQILAIH